MTDNTTPRANRFDEVRQSGGELTEYAVRYDAPEVYAGVITHTGYVRSLAESIARAEEKHIGGEFKCTVVQRTVTFSDWRPCGDR